MPTYRKLHTKILDSYDFAEMPNDFTRVFWMLLIVVVDSEGRAIDNPAWIKSKMFPLRSDVSNKQIEDALSWLETRKMIIRYKVSGRSYFYVSKFKNYQTGTEREAKSVLPPPEESLTSDSGVTQEEVETNSTATVYVNASVNESESVNESVYESVPEELRTNEFMNTWKEWEVYRKQIKKPLTKIGIKKQLKSLIEHGPDIAIKMLNQSMENGWQGIFELRENNNGHKSTLPLIDDNGRVNI
jgi:hypothetical protein